MSAYSPSADNADAPRKAFDGREEHPAPYIPRRWATLAIWAVVSIAISYLAAGAATQTGLIDQTSGMYYPILGINSLINMALVYIMVVGPARAFMTRGGFLDSLRFLVSYDSLTSFVGATLFLFLIYAISVPSHPNPGVLSAVQMIVSIIAVANGLALVVRNQRMTYCMTTQEYKVYRVEQEVRGIFKKMVSSLFRVQGNVWPIAPAFLASAVVPVFVQDILISIFQESILPYAAIFSTIVTLGTVALWVIWCEWGGWTRLFRRITDRSLIRTIY